MSHRIVAISDRGLRPGDFGATVRDGELLIPASIARRMAAHRILTAERLAELAFDLPGVLAGLLGWTKEDVVRARAGLVSTLRDHVDPEVLEPSEPFERGFGALHPHARR